MTALAGLHGPSWCDPVWLDFPGIAFARPDEASAQGLGEVARMSPRSLWTNSGTA